MSNNEVGKPSNLELAIKIAEYGNWKENTLEHHQSCLLFCTFYCIANDIANSFAALELNSRLEVFFTSLLDIPCSILDIQSQSWAGPEGGNLPLIGYSCLPAIMRIAGIEPSTIAIANKPYYAIKIIV
jgi:hypothetical protein